MLYICLAIWSSICWSVCLSVYISVCNAFVKISEAITKSFTKIRIDSSKKDTKKTPVDVLIEEKRKLKTQLGKESKVSEKHVIEDKIEIIEEKIAEVCAERNAKEVEDHLKILIGKEGKFNNNNVWKLKRKLFPRPREVPVAKRNTEGILVTNPEMLKSLYKEVYQERLSPMEILPYLRPLKKIRED